MSLPNIEPGGTEVLRQLLGDIAGDDDGDPVAADDLCTWQFDTLGTRLEAGSSAGRKWHAEARTIGTWNGADHSWLWAWHNPSIPKTSAFRAEAGAIAALRSLIGYARFRCDEAEALRLGRWIAARAGWRGATCTVPGTPLQRFTGIGRPPTHVLAAVRAIAWVEPGRVCALCSGDGDDAGGLRPGALGSACGACIASVREALEEETSPPLDSPQRQWDIGPPCVLCGGKGPRVIGFDGGALCVACVGTTSAPR